MTKSVRMLNNGTDMLDEILQVGKGSKDYTGIRFNSQSLYKQCETFKKVFVSPKSKTELIMSDNISKHLVNSQKRHYKAKFVPWKCHYCGRNGHIRPYCFELYGYPKQVIPPKSNCVVTKEWRAKGINTCHIVQKPLRTSNIWYFDSGCSRHMTVFKKYLVEIKPYRTSFVTFGD